MLQGAKNSALVVIPVVRHYARWINHIGTVAKIELTVIWWFTNMKSNKFPIAFKAL